MLVAGLSSCVLTLVQATLESPLISLTTGYYEFRLLIAFQSTMKIALYYNSMVPMISSNSAVMIEAAEQSLPIAIFPLFTVAMHAYIHKDSQANTHIQLHTILAGEYSILS